MQEDAAVTARFDRQPRLTVSAAGLGSGTVIGPGIDCGSTCVASYDPRTQITLVAVPSPDSFFAGWQGACVGTGFCVLTMTEDATVTATFEVREQLLTVSTSGSGAGTVTSVPAGIDCGFACVASYAPGTPVTLSATPAPGSVFAGWGEPCSGTGSCAVIMDESVTVTATFALQRRTLTVSRAGSGDGMVTSAPAGIDCGSACVASYDPGTVVTLTATPAPGSVFAGWSGGACGGLDPCRVTMTEDAVVTATFVLAPPTTQPKLVNVSTRGPVGTGDNVMIGGLIVQGITPKTVLLRGRGPSLGAPPFFVPGPLANPLLRLFSGPTLIAQNDDWQGPSDCSVACGVPEEIMATGFDPCQPNPGQETPPPGCNQEAALLVTLPPGGYTVQLSGASGETGVGLFEAFETDGNTTSAELYNISTRGVVLTGDNIMIGGFVVEGSSPKTVLVRGRGPALAAAPFFVPGVLADPLLRIFSGPTVVAQNNNWQDAPSCSPGFTCGGAPEITATGLDPCQPNPGQGAPPPNCGFESSILITLPPGAYTVQLSGAAGQTGVGLVEVFEVN